MTFSTLSLDHDDGIATITLDRAEKLNAFTAEMRDELVAAFDQTDRDDAVRAVILTGAGRAFCAGADLSQGASSFETPSGTGERFRDSAGVVTMRIFESIKPVIAAVNGAAVGVGATMLLPADVRIASSAARFGFVFTRRGIVPEGASSWFLPRLVGMEQALRWCYSGRVFDAEEALRGRLVSEVVAPERLLDRARTIARELTQDTSAVSVALVRQLMWRMYGAQDPWDAHQIDSRFVQAMGRSADVREGVLSFMAKRPPAFTMRPSTDLPADYPWWKPRAFE